MSQPQHIPPPWTANGTMIDCHNGAGTRYTIATVNSPWWLGDGAFETRQANAQLIASAPDLLASLQELVDYADLDPGRRRRAEAAIAKAKGDVLDG